MHIESGHFICTWPLGNHCSIVKSLVDFKYKLWTLLVFFNCKWYLFMGHKDFLRSLWTIKIIVCIMWTFVLFSIWNKSIDVKFGVSFKFMTCNNMFDVFMDIYDSFPIWSGCIDGQYSCMHYRVKMFGCKWVNVWNNRLLELGRSSTFKIYVVFLWTLGTCIWVDGFESIFGYFLNN